MTIEIIKGAADNPVAKFFCSSPETDALISVGLENADRECVPAEFARKLEGERDEAREKAERYRLEANAIMMQRDEARSEISLKQQTLTIAEGTLSDLRKERDEWSAMCGRYKRERDIAEDERIDMAQQLESEKQCHDRCQNERDALVQKLDAWEEIAEHLHHFVQYPAYGVDQAIRRMDVLEAYKHLKK